MKIIRLIVLSVLLFGGFVSAKEGMWIPVLLEKYNIADMQEMGFRLSTQDIYDINNASMKDAVVVFGGGCTGEMVSAEGLLLTNHHCGYRQIQEHSSVENDYLTDGFWAMSRDEELPNPGLTVRFLEYMEDVTDGVLNETEDLDAGELEKRISENIAGIVKDASEQGEYTAQVKPLFYGNQYYLYVYKTYRDVRLVGAPPSSVGKFGGDTDNWMWPRHTGDFSLFRVYAGKDNEPADYSPDNVPFKPKKFFKISLDGVEEGDFTLIFGNPGTTMQYIPSYEVDIIQNQRDPDRIAIRDKKLEIFEKYMESGSAIRIQYSAKHASVSNAWKKWQGEIKGLERLNAVNEKLNFENDFKIWSENNGSWENSYRQTFESFEKLYFIYKDYIKASDYYSEIIFNGIEVFRPAALVNGIVKSIENDQNHLREIRLESILEYLPGFFKDFHQPVDEEMFLTLLPLVDEDLKSEFVPGHLSEILKRFPDKKLLKKIYRKSKLTDEAGLTEIFNEKNYNKLLNLRDDPLVKLYNRLSFHFETEIKPVVDALSVEINRNMKDYMAGIMEMKKDEAFYPDANMTLRVGYGKVEGYKPQNGIEYKYYTTLEGVMEKNDPENYDYSVPEKLKELYESKDYGVYSDKQGNMPVCFVASNHTSGGNSGSPIINGDGYLVGINFDRCWEGTMSDIMYDPEQSRNISIDIRYALFLIDKFAGAGYLLDEMELIGGEK